MNFRKDWMDRWATYAPIKMAVNDADTGENYTYQQLNSQSNYLAQSLEEMGLTKGDRVAVLSEYRLEYIVLLGAAMKLGITIVPLNYRLSSRELAYMINNCEPKLIVSEEKYENLYSPELIECDIQSVILMDEFASDLSKKINVSYTYEAKEIEDDHPLFIIYTSGTTGFPKGAIYTHKMAFWNAVNTQARLDLTSRDHTIICMPPFHTGGWNVLLMPFLLQGGSFTLLRKFDASIVMKLLGDEEATLFMGVPTMLKMMSEVPEFESISLDSLRYFIVGGEAMPLPLIQQWQKKGTPIRQGFGLTEVGPNVFSLHQDDAIRKIGSIGTPNFFIETKLMKSDGTEADANEEGELWLKGPVTTPGYWENIEATLKSFTEGWFKTGDILVRDEGGYYFVKDRIKNMFISGGENVYPAEVERFLQTHPEINEVAVIAIQDDKWGEAGKAIIIKKDTSLSKDLVIHFCKGSLAKYKIPKEVEFVTELPKTASGKIDRKKLKASYA
ncbi:class I adenylate-forming enzyme family protein [Ekhidna sp.]